MKTLASKVFHRNKSVRHIKLMHPYRDWIFGLLIALLIILLVASWSVFVYLEQRNSMNLNDGDVEVAIPVYQADLIDQALAVFEARAIRTQTISAGAVTVPAVPELSTATSSEQSNTEDPSDAELPEAEQEQEPQEQPDQESEPEQIFEDSEGEVSVAF